MILATAVLSSTVPPSNETAGAEELPVPGHAGTRKDYPVDLPTVLKLAGARNLDIEIARRSLAEARGRRDSALELFLPRISPGVVWRRHAGLIQGTDGVIVDVDRDSRSAGGIVAVQADVGAALYGTLEMHRLTKAAEQDVAIRLEAAILDAAGAYFDLVRARTSVAAAEEAVRISRDYEEQVSRAVATGIAFKGDELRVRVQTRKNEMAHRKSTEDLRLASARLSDVLHLDATVNLTPVDSVLVPLSLVGGEADLEALVAEGLASRPELKRARAATAAASSARNGALFGPIFPALGGAAFFGELAGGPDNVPGRSGSTRDYAATLSWRIGPGGLLDFGRIRTTRARFEARSLEADRLRDDITREVVEGLTRFRSLSDQVATAGQGLRAAEETLRLSRERREFGVGLVLEYIEAQEQLTRARNDLDAAIAEFNKAQYALLWATGRLEAQ